MSQKFQLAVSKIFGISNQHYSKLTTFVPYVPFLTSDQFCRYLSKWIFILEHKLKQMSVNEYNFIF